jgi:hypothetical protein
MNTTTSNFSRVLGLFIILFGVAGLASLAFAEGPVIRSGQTVGVEANQLLEGDFYGLGNTVTISGEATRDVYALGGTVMTNAPVNEDLVVVGGMVQVNGTVKDDARIVGGEVIIADRIEDDVVVIAGKLHILSTASIVGDLIFMGGEIVIDGPIEGTVYGTGGTIRIDSKVGGDVTVRSAESFTLGDAADIGGNIVYRSDRDIVRGQGAVVAGTLTKESPAGENDAPVLKSLVLNLLIIVFSSLAVFFLAKSRVRTLVENIMTGYGRLGLIGLGMMLAIPVVAVILMTSIIGLLIGVLLLFGYIVLMLLALISLPLLLGSLVQRAAKMGNTITLITVLIGVLSVFLLPFVPFIGLFLLFAGLVVVMGAFGDELYGFFKQS